MLASGSVVGGRFRVLRSLAPAANSVAVAQALDGGRPYWLVEAPVSVSEARLSELLERHGRFALGVPGLARPVASCVDAEAAFLAFAAPASGSVAEAHTVAWPVERVATLATRIAAALAPLHDQGIAHGCLLPELVAESEAGDVLFGFGVAAVATAFGAAGEASQLLSPEYRAPELRASLLPPTPASDVFALGVLSRALLSEPNSSATPRVPLAAELEALLSRAEAPSFAARPEVRAFAAEFVALAARAAASAVPATSSPAEAERAAEHVEPLVAPVSSSLLLVSPVSPASVLVPAPPGAGPLSGMPPEPAFAPPSAASTQRAGLIALIVVAFGFLVMAGGVVGAIVYASHRAATIAKSIAAVPKARPPVTAPKVAPAPAPSDVDEPPLAAPAPEPESAAPERRPARRHAPIVAPGVGPSSYPEDARVALPVLGNEPIWGTRNATLTWVFFGDLDCPYSRRAWRSLEAAKASFGDDLRIVFRHRPLREHPNADNAARVLAGLARRKGSQAFFDVLHRVVQLEGDLTPERLSAELAAAGFGDSKLPELARAGEAAVLADVQLAGQFAVKSTPFSFLNGLGVDGDRSLTDLQQLLSDEQRSATWLSAAGVPAAALYATRTSSNLIGVGDPVDARACVPIAASPTRGPTDALVTLVEFADFECPYCSRAESTLTALLARYPKTLRLVWKDYPLPQHKDAQLLANFAAEARRRGASAGFWTVHDALFANSGSTDDATLGSVAGKAGLDSALLLISAHNGVHDAEIRAEMALGQKLGVNGTPTFFANGRRIQGALPLAQFDALIREELKTAQRIVARGTAPRDVYRLACD